MKNRNDQRVVKTRESLVNAYLELVMSNASNKVLEICQKANITPITFYHHFGDKYELIKYVVQYQLQHTLPIPEKLKPSGTKQLFIYLTKSITTFFINNKEVVFNSLETILNKGYKYSYVDVLTTTIEYRVNKEFEVTNELIDLSNLIIKFFVGGLLFISYSLILHQEPLDIFKIVKALKLFALILIK